MVRKVDTSEKLSVKESNLIHTKRLSDDMNFRLKNIHLAQATLSVLSEEQAFHPG